MNEGLNIFYRHIDEVFGVEKDESELLTGLILAKEGVAVNELAKLDIDTYEELCDFLDGTFVVTAEEADQYIQDFFDNDLVFKALSETYR